MPETLAPGVHCFDGECSPVGLQLGTRMTAIQLSAGGLWLHSPRELDDETRTELEALGSVKFIVAPNKVHHLFVAPYPSAFRGATLVGAPGLAKKRADLPFEAELGDEAPPEWASDIEQTLLRGAPYVNEVVFFHRGSKSLLLTDLAFNFASHGHWWTRTYLGLMDGFGFGPSRVMRACIRDEKAARASIDRVLEWDFDRVILPHGDVLEHGGREALRAAYAWL
jgi:Domain of unknown function (DUF4336)